VKIEKRLRDFADIDRLIRDACPHDRERIAHRLKTDLFLLVRDDEPPHALIARGNHSAE